MVLAEELSSGGANECQDCLVLDAAFYRDGVEMLLKSLQLSDGLHPVLATDFLFDHRGSGEDPIAVLAECFQGRAHLLLQIRTQVLNHELREVFRC